jgi:serine protease Do
MHRLFALPIACLLLATLACASDAAPATYAPMIGQVEPAVVTVYTSKAAAPQRRMIAPFQEDDPMRFFFGGDPHGMRIPQGGRSQRQLGQGSGVIVTTDGVILTNNHVIDGADEIEVQLHGAKDRIKASLVGTDPKTDVAVLRIEAKGLRLSPIAFADSDKVQVGDLAFAIGNPFGVGSSVSMGIVSATGRSEVGIADYEDFIQTDASINPGNSGGALVDSLGRLVGINTAIYSRGGGNIGIGFAVPTNLARRMMEQLLAGGKVVRGYLGVQIGEVTPELARKFQVEAGHGALVGEVLDDGPAAKGGMQAGDVITRMNDVVVNDPRQLRMQVAGVKPGTEAHLTVVRDGHEKQLTVTIGELPGGSVAATSGGEDGDAGNRLGVVLQDLQAQARQQADIPSKVQGALIVQVEDGSRAERAGLRPGMVITEVERRAVADASAAVQQLRLSKGDVLLRVWFDGSNRWIVVPE